SLLELIVKTGIADAINRMPDGIKSSRGAIAETIENNVRRKIVKEHLNDPAFYDKMSVLLDKARRQHASRLAAKTFEVCHNLPSLLLRHGRPAAVPDQQFGSRPSGR